MSRAPAAALAAALLGGVLALGGCSDGGSEPAPGASGSVTETPSADTSTGAAPTSQATTEPPEVAPATGELVEMNGMSLRVPDDFEVKSPDGISFVAIRRGNVIIDTLTVRSQDNLGITSSFKEAIRFRNRLQIFYQHDPRVLAPVMIDGVRMFHLSGMVSDHLWAEAYGTDLGDRTIDISFIFGPKTSAADRRETVAETLATVQVD